jgi:hypothetical protein
LSPPDFISSRLRSAYHALKLPRRAFRRIVEAISTQERTSDLVCNGEPVVVATVNYASEF